MSLRSKIMGISAINKIKIRQRARLATIKLGDANTRLFHLRANGRRRKNFIPILSTPGGMAVTHDEKEEALRAHFAGFLGTAQERSSSLNWGALGYMQHDLGHLDAPFSMEELHDSVFALPAEKAHGPDGYNGLFFQACWNTIADDLYAAVMVMTQHGGANMGLLNIELSFCQRRRRWEASQITAQSV